MDSIEMLQKMIDDAKKIVFFSGAGVSTLSGIKDFRSPDGLYQMKYKYPPEYMLSEDCLYKHTEDFFDFYREYLNCLEYEPNIVHQYIVDLEKRGKDVVVVTQNIDGLHTKAGSKKVYEIHGSVYRNYCDTCMKDYDSDAIFSSTGVPSCTCGGIIRPDVVLYGEMLPQDDFAFSIDAIREADLLIVAGTSLTVYPASGMIREFGGENMVLLNRDATPNDADFDLVIHDDFQNIFSKLK
ncbi:MAG: NAD-dependent protein deacylase [Bacilli bacterium]|nr:NAD-dependent protein deacylase [Bacilli bacterium]